MALLEKGEATSVREVSKLSSLSSLIFICLSRGEMGLDMEVAGGSCSVKAADLGGRSMKLTLQPTFISPLSLGNLASPSNPDGKIPFCVAENKLTQDRLSPRFIKAASVAFSNHESWEYNDMTGLSQMKVRGGGKRGS